MLTQSLLIVLILGPVSSTHPLPEYLEEEETEGGWQVELALGQAQITPTDGQQIPLIVHNYLFP